MIRRIKQVIILGAGASKSEGAPLQNELFEVFYKDYKQELKDKVWTTLQNNEKELIITFFKDFWGINIENPKTQNFPTFEECLGTLDLAHLRNESFKGYSHDEIEKTRNAFIFLIAEVLYESLKHNKKKHHRHLITRLVQEENFEKTAFISLNNDILIDDVLIDECQYLNVNLDYGIDFINSDLKNPINDTSILLLKMHGSMNWLFCPKCQHMTLFSKKMIATEAFYFPRKCETCGVRMEPIIIPPTYYKEMSNRLLNRLIHQIFLKADEILRQADKIFICGYSFPDADFHIKYLLKKAEIFRGKTPEIRVINNHIGKTEQQKEEEKQRFIRFFKDKDKIHYTDESFEDFA